MALVAVDGDQGQSVDEDVSRIFNLPQKAAAVVASKLARGDEEAEP